MLTYTPIIHEIYYYNYYMSKVILAMLLSVLDMRQPDMESEQM